LLVERRCQGETSSKAWSSIVAARDGGDSPVKRLSVGGAAGGEDKEGGDGNDSEERRSMCADEERGGQGGTEEGGQWERDEGGNRSWVARPATGQGDVEMKEGCEGEVTREGVEGGGGWGRRKAIVNGNSLFGLSHDKVCREQNGGDRERCKRGICEGVWVCECLGV